MSEINNAKPAYLLDADKVLAGLKTSRQGLNADEAARRLEQYGLNKLEKAHKQSWMLR